MGPRSYLVNIFVIKNNAKTLVNGDKKEAKGYSQNTSNLIPECFPVFVDAFNCEHLKIYHDFHKYIQLTFSVNPSL